MIKALVTLAFLSQSANTFYPGVAQATNKPWVKLRFAPGGGGQGQYSSLCDVFRSELTGNFFCLHGDGGTSDGGFTLTAGGAVPAIDTDLCPNGPNCNPVTVQQFNGTSTFYDSTVAQESPPGDFSCVWAGSFGDTPIAAQDLISKFENAGSAQVFRFLLFFGIPVIQIYKDDVTFTQVNPGTGVASAEYRTAAFTYDFVTDGTSVLTVYLDGVSVASSNTAVGPAQDDASGKYHVGVLPGAGTFVTSNALDVMCTEKVLSSTTISKMDALVKTSRSGTLGEIVNTSRSTIRNYLNQGTNTSTTKSASFLTTAGGAFVQAGIKNDPGKTNIVRQNRDLSQAVWTKTNMTCTKTADGLNKMSRQASTCTSTAANGQATITTVTGLSLNNSSWFIKRRTGTGNILLTRDNFATTTNVTASVNSSTYTRLSTLTHSTLSSVVANPTVGIRLATNGDAVDIDYVQNEGFLYPTDPIQTAAAATARAVEANVLTSPIVAGADLNNWCFTLRATPPAGSTWAGYSTILEPVRVLAYYGINATLTNVVEFAIYPPNLFFCVYNGVGAFSCVSEAGAGIPDGAHNFRACNDGTNVRLWRDEALIGTTALTTPLAAAPPFLLIGAYGDGTAGSSFNISNFCHRTGQGTCP